MKQLVQIDEWGNLMDGRETVMVNGVALPSGMHPKANIARANTALLADAINTERETGKTPRQLAEENEKLRKLCGDFLSVSVCAINAGDWKVDGAADPDSLIREAQRII